MYMWTQCSLQESYPYTHFSCYPISTIYRYSLLWESHKDSPSGVRNRYTKSMYVLVHVHIKLNKTDFKLQFILLLTWAAYNYVTGRQSCLQYLVKVQHVCGMQCGLLCWMHAHWELRLLVQASTCSFLANWDRVGNCFLFLAYQEYAFVFRGICRTCL